MINRFILPPRRSWIARVLLLAASLGLSAPTSVQGEEASVTAIAENTCCGHGGYTQVRECDTVWMVSSRCLGCTPAGQDRSLLLEASRYIEGEGWVPLDSPAEMIAQIAPESRAVFFMHGNRVESYEAAPRGWDVYHQLVDNVEALPPMHFIIWSWPAGNRGGPLNDVRIKAALAPLEAYTLGAFLNKLDDTHVGLIGFSMGARLATGAMHVLQGGVLAGRALEEEAYAGPQDVTATLYAAALDNNWLLPGRNHGCALEGNHSITNIYNCCDPVLKWYRFISRCYNPTALGYTGLAGRSQLMDLADHYEQRSVSCLIGRSHDLYDFICSPRILRWTAESLQLWSEAEEAHSQSAIPSLN